MVALAWERDLVASYLGNTLTGLLAPSWVSSSDCRLLLSPCSLNSGTLALALLAPPIPLWPRNDG